LKVKVPFNGLLLLALHALLSATYFPNKQGVPAVLQAGSRNQVEAHARGLVCGQSARRPGRMEADSGSSPAAAGCWTGSGSLSTGEPALLLPYHRHCMHQLMLN
jgi:hypothetical protein